MKRHAILLTIFMMVSKVLGIVREGFLAYYYGATSYADIYVTANAIPNVVFGFIAVGLTSTFIPIYSRVMHEKGNDRANEYLSNVLNIMFVLSIVLLALGLIFTEQLVSLFAKGFSGEVFVETVRFVKVSLFAILAIGIFNILSGYHEYHNRFLVKPISGFIVNFIVILSIVISSKTYPIAMAYGLVIGTITQAIFTFVVAYMKEDFKFIPRINLKDEYLKPMIFMALPIIFGSSINQINTIIDRSIASTLPEGAIATLNYADRISGSIYTLFGTTITTVTYPTLTRQGAEGDYDALKLTVQKIMIAVVMILVPASIGIMVLSEPIVNLLYGRGTFGADAAALILTAQTLAVYSIGIIGNSLRDILTRTFYSLEDSKTPVFSAVIAVVMNIILDLILVKYWGVVGLALATSISSIVAVVVLYFALYRKVKGMNLRKFLVKSLKVLFASLIMGALVYFSNNYMTGISINYKISMILSIGIGGLSYLIIMKFMRIAEFDEVVDSVTSRIASILGK